jgi:hypothetical protein
MALTNARCLDDDEKADIWITDVSFGQHRPERRARDKLNYDRDN